MPGMAIDLESAELGAVPEPDVEAFTVEPVLDPATLDTFLAIAVPALDAPPEFGPVFRRVVLADGFGEDRLIRNFLGRAGGVAVTTSTLMTGGGVAGIYNVATEAAYRRRGLGAAMTVAALEEGRRLGLRIGGLQSSELGHGVYEALGFRDIGAFGIRVMLAPP